MKARDEPRVLSRPHESQRYVRLGERGHVEVGSERNPGHDRSDPRIAVGLPGRVGESVADDPKRDRLLWAIEEVASETSREAHAGLERFTDVGLAELLEVRGRPTAAGQAQRRVPASRHPVHADLVVRQERFEARVPSDHVDGARHLGRSAPPTRWPRGAVVLEVVALVLWHRHDEPVFDERAREIGVNHRRPARAVRDHDQPSVAAHGRALPGHVEGERAAFDWLCFAAGWVENGDGAVAVFAGNLREADGGLAPGGPQEEDEQQQEVRTIHGSRLELKQYPFFGMPSTVSGLTLGRGGAQTRLIPPLETKT